MQAVRVKAGHCADGILTGVCQLGKCIEQLRTYAKVCKLERSILIVDAMHRHSGLVGLGREQRPDVGLPGTHGLCRFQRTSSAYHAQPYTALVVLGCQNFDLSHLSGGAGVGAAAGADIRTRDGHDAHLPFDLLFGAVDKGGKLLPGGVADQHRHILPHDAVGGKLGCLQALGRNGHAGVHAHSLGTDVEAHILGPEHLVQDAGKDVLTGVLLHFVKAPFPVDAAGHGSAGNSAFRQSVHAVPEDAVMLVHIGHIQRGTVRQGQGAPVGRLTAALRVEHRAVQRNAPAAGLFVRLCGKDGALALGAESVLFKVFFCALHGAGTSCSGCSLTI